MFTSKVNVFAASSFLAIARQDDTGGIVITNQLSHMGFIGSGWLWVQFEKLVDAAVDGNL